MEDEDEDRSAVSVGDDNDWVGGNRQYRGARIETPSHSVCALYIYVIRMNS